MTIVRVHHNKENPYVSINKKALLDPNLSLEAVGLWARLLSRPDNWNISVHELTKSCGCGKDRIYRILNELIENGYAYRSQPKNKKDGRFQNYETHVLEFKATPEEIKEMFPEPGFPVAEVPLAEVPVSGKADTTKYIDTEYRKKRVQKEKEKNLLTQVTKEPPNTPLLSLGSHVKISAESLKKLEDRFGSNLVKDVIENMNDYCANKLPKGYADYEAAIRNWCKKETKETTKPKSYKNETKRDEIARRQLEEYEKHNGSFNDNPAIIRFT